MSTGLEAKLVVLGQASVGKTSFVIRYCKGTFDPDASSTIGASFLAKKVVVDDCVVRLQIWVFFQISLRSVLRLKHGMCN